MTTQKVGTMKIPMFDKNNYGLWKKKMTIFLQVANVKYFNVLKTVPKIPMVIKPEQVENEVVIAPARTYQKDPKEYTSDEKDDASLDLNL